MDHERPIYLLARRKSGNLRKADPLIQAVLSESGAVSPTIAYVGAANGDDEGFFNRFAEIIKEAGDCKIRHAIISPWKADLEKSKDILKSAEIVFMSGGDVYRGMRMLQRRKMTEFLSQLYEQGKIFFGLSAGSIMLAKEWVRWRNPEDDSTAELFPCLGFAQIICDTHEEQEGWHELKTLLRLEQNNVRGYGIVTGTAIKVLPDGKIEALGGAIHQYIRRGSKVVRGPDIVPAINK